MKTSAGILFYKIIDHQTHFLLVHPGGPFFKNKDNGWWTIPKGEPEEGEEMEATARREVLEETGIPVPDKLISLGTIKQKGGKTVTAWAAESDWDSSVPLPENTFEIEWPPSSGRKQAFPEIDQATWFTYEEAKDKINAAQLPFLEKVNEHIRQ